MDVMAVSREAADGMIQRGLERGRCTVRRGRRIWFRFRICDGQGALYRSKGKEEELLDRVEIHW